MPVALSGLQDYARRMQSTLSNAAGNGATNSTQSDGITHPAAQKFIQSAQDTVNQLPTSISAPPDPSVPGSGGAGVSGLSSTPNTNATQPSSNPNNPQTQNDMPNVPTTEEMAGAGNGGGNTLNTSSHSDNITGAANAMGAAPAPTVDPTLMQDHSFDPDPIAQMGSNADAALAAQKAAQLRASQNSTAQGFGNQGGLNNVNSVAGFNGDQVNNAKAIINAGLARGMSRDDIQTALMASLAESSLRNINGGDRDSLGLFQERPSQGWGTPQQIMDAGYASNKFYDALSGIANRTQMTPWQAAQAVERSAYSDGSNYQRQFGAAQSLMNALYNNNNGSNNAAYSPTGMKPNGSLTWINQNTNKYLDFDHAYGAQCVDLYAFYTTGFAGGTAPPVGYADEIWNNYDPKAYAQVGRNNIPQMGDVAIFGKGPGTPMSHVGIVTQDLGNGMLRTLSNNATSAGPNGNSAIVDLSKQNIIGYLRPRRLM